MKKVLVLNGPNLNLLGTRENDIYGNTTYGQLCESLKKEAGGLNLEVETFQSNHEGELVDKIQGARNRVDAIIINPGAYTHTSIAIRDAFAAVRVPFIEVHISNVFAREEFRRHSFLSDLASGVLAGFGTQGYSMALRAAAGLAGQAKKGDA